ncbi:hypothetical protein HanPI659440_Chr12g0460571 [Helianthus annuus]|nr:hypothetical protein HanPI659440_Chr12g0460571 [Helianthus annuus]
MNDMRLEFILDDSEQKRGTGDEIRTIEEKKHTTVFVWLLCAFAFHRFIKFYSFKNGLCLIQ